jgi:hypothetical protein
MGAALLWFGEIAPGAQGDVDHRVFSEFTAVVPSQGMHAILERMQAWTMGRMTVAASPLDPQ